MTADQYLESKSLPKRTPISGGQGVVRDVTIDVGINILSSNRLRHTRAGAVEGLYSLSARC